MVEMSPEELRALEEPLDPSLFSTLKRLVADENHRCVISLGGGSLPGMAGNIALLRMLEELGLQDHVDEVWGTSAGACIGGAWASGRTADEILDYTLRLKTEGGVDIKWFKLALGILLRPLGRPLPDGVIGGRVFWKVLEMTLKVKTFEECRIPFRCIACTDDGRATRAVFRRGELLPAIFSSMSIPGIVVPRERRPGEECGYYDGGLVEKTPLISPIADHSRLGDERQLLLIGTHFANDTRRTPLKGFLDRFLYSMYALEDLAWSYQLAEARSKPNVTLVLLNPHLDDPALFDFDRLRSNYLQARSVFIRELQNARLAFSFGKS